MADPKKGTGKKPKGSDRRLYTDENPRDTVKIKFATPALVIPAPFSVGRKFFLFLAGMLSCRLIKSYPYNIFLNLDFLLSFHLHLIL